MFDSVRNIVERATKNLIAERGWECGLGGLIKYIFGGSLHGPKSA